MRKLTSVSLIVLIAVVLVASSGCTRTEAKPPAQQALPVQSFAPLLQMPRGRLIDLRKALPAATLELLVETEVGQWRTAHILIGMIKHNSDAMMDVRIRTTLVEMGSVADRTRAVKRRATR